MTTTTTPRTDRLATLRALAETDPYFRGYLDGLTDTRKIRDRSTNR